MIGDGIESLATDIFETTQAPMYLQQKILESDSLVPLS